MIYVDPLVVCPKWRGGFKACHMFSDGSTEELVAFAERIGMAQNWLQFSRSGLPHFDCSERMRRLAVIAGAIPVSREEAFEIWKKAGYVKRRGRIVSARIG